MKLFLLTACLCIASVCLVAQNIGDYRSNSSYIENWENISHWQEWNGIDWVQAQSCPGSSVTTKSITITSGTTAILDSDDTLQFSHCVVEQNAVLELRTTPLVVTNAMRVYGTLRYANASGNAMFGNLIIDGGVCEHFASKKITIKNNLELTNASFIGLNTSSIPEYAIENSCIICPNSVSTISHVKLIVEDSMHIQGNLVVANKIGTKTVNGDFVIASTGSFVNQDNDRWFLYGNMCNYGSITNSNGVFVLRGMHKSIHGSFTIAKLYVDGSYTNYDTIKVKASYQDAIFSGNGEFIQAENAVLISYASTAPTIIASAHNNTVSFERGGNTIIQGGVYYNLVVKPNRNSPLYVLGGNVVIANSIQFLKPGYIDLQGFQLRVSSSSQNSIQYNHAFDRGIILNGGNVILENAQPYNSITIPLFYSEGIEHLAHVSFSNFDNQVHDFIIDSIGVVFPEFMQSSVPSTFIKRVFYISSTSPNAELTLYWHANQELPAFDNAFSKVMHWNGSVWESLSDCSSSQLHNSNIFSQTGVTHSFSPFSVATELVLPIIIEEFTADSFQGKTTVQWSTSVPQNNLHYILSTSVEGIVFTQIDSGVLQVHNQIKRTQYKDMYYKLEVFDGNNQIYAHNLFVEGVKVYMNFIVTKDVLQCITCSDTDEIAILYNQNGEEVLHFNADKAVNIGGLSKGIYLLALRFHNQKVMFSLMR